MAKYFSKTYGEARWLFKEAALDMSKRYKYAEYRTVRVPSRTDQDLTIDTFFLPAQSHAERIVIFAAGVHGVEGMTGSAIELLCMKEDIITRVIDKATTGILFLHAINPYGQKYHRRVTENNVDLGRNFVSSNMAFSSQSGAHAGSPIPYEVLSNFLNPGKKLSYNPLRKLAYLISSGVLLSKHTLPRLRQGILEGQYSFEKGLFFGGIKHEPHVRIIDEILREYLAHYKRILAMDLHTGYGTPANLHFFLPYAKDNGSNMEALKSVFKDYKVECVAEPGNRSDAYEVTGSLLEYIEGLAPGKTYVPIVLKFGTIDKRRLLSQLAALSRIIAENQCIQYGYKTEKDKKLIQKRFCETYFPESETWRCRVIETAREALPGIIERFQSL